MWTGREKSQTIIVGGYSPTIRCLPVSLLTQYPVIGINMWGAEFHCDYWLGCDTGLNWDKYALNRHDEYSHLPKFLNDLDCPKFMRRPNPETEAFVPDDAGIFFDKTPNDDPIQTTWNGTLRDCSSSAIAAINLAIILGAAQVILYGVDFVGSKRADGSSYSRPDFWDAHKEPINNCIREFSQQVPIFKTNAESWLDCPYLEL